MGEIHFEPKISFDEEQEAGNSLPTVDEYKFDVPTQRMTRGRKMVWIAFVCSLVFVLSLLAGFFGSKQKDTVVQRGVPSSEIPYLLRVRTASKFIQDISLSTKHQLQTSGTPQNQALTWIATQDAGTGDIPFTIAAPGASTFAQRYVLAVLYYSLDGPHWKFQSDFLSALDECDWNRGIQTSSSTSYKFGASCSVKGIVDKLFMPANNLNGRLPAELGYLTDLSHISFYDNEITGAFPEPIRTLTNLNFFAMERNKIEGLIPPWIGTLTNLRTLALGDNGLNGTLPATLSKLTSLHEVALESNQLSGQVDVFFNLPHLLRLYLGENRFEGTIDDAFFAGSKLKELDLCSNFFLGKVPLHMFNEHTLEILDLNGNALDGALPSGITSNTKMVYLSAYDNQLLSSIPTTIANLKHLEHLDLSANKFDDTIPTSIAYMTKLTYLFLARNNFTSGPLPDLSNLVNLQEISLKQNKLTGSIPTAIGLLTNLVLLDMGNNELRGHLPLAMESLTMLRFLILNDNKLSGTITKGFKHLESIDMILLDKNNITGGAQHVCGQDGPSNPSVFSADCCQGEGCMTGKFECTCCTLCCADSENCYDDSDLMANYDADWFQTGDQYARDAYVFSENIVFQT